MSYALLPTLETTISSNEEKAAEKGVEANRKTI